MRDGTINLLTLGGLTVEQDTLVRVPEPPGSAAAILCQRLLAGTYDKPILVEDGEFRALCFSIDGSIQSEMRVDEPEALVTAYTRKMMAFLLFCPRPRHVLMLGLGGGSLLKFCHRNLPDTRVTAVEIDAHVIALRSHFNIPPDSSALRVIHADGGRHVADMASTDERIDVLLVDAYDRKGIAQSVAQPEFFANARRVLADDGVFVMNLAAYESDCAMHLQLIRSVFGEPVIAVPVGWGGNTVVFAGPALGERRCLAAAPKRARLLQEKLNLSFPKLPGLVSEYLRHVPSAVPGPGMD
ncbi:MAG: fused MFS/spermidine synthase [Steroidobacteraceae bacterium]|nr:fused MFS/spermidine synthase [Steroidobacteraceae bacterium]